MLLLPVMMNKFGLIKWICQHGVHSSEISSSNNPLMLPLFKRYFSTLPLSYSYGVVVDSIGIADSNACHFRAQRVSYIDVNSVKFKTNEKNIRLMHLLRVSIEVLTSGCFITTKSTTIFSIQVDRFGFLITVHWCGMKRPISVGCKLHSQHSWIPCWCIEGQLLLVAL